MALITKKQLERTIQNFPDEFTLEELIEKLILLDKIQRGDEDSRRGDVISDEQLDSELEKWFK